MTLPDRRENAAIEATVIGGSAGALEALASLLEGLPAGLRVPIAIVVHIARNKPSALGSVLAAHSALPVCEAEDKAPLEPGHAYVAPPGYHVLIERGPSFALSVDAPVNFSQPSIDVLFESAAAALGPAVAGVLLSGANEDGARGLLAISEAGGVAMVQEPGEAASRTMPEAALRTCPRAAVAHIAGIRDRLVELDRRSRGTR